MKSIKYAAAAILTAFAFTVSAQTSADNESNVESEYLSSIEDVVITELATSEERDNKLVALQYLENAVNEGLLLTASSRLSSWICSWPWIILLQHRMSGKPIVSHLKVLPDSNNKNDSCNHSKTGKMLYLCRVFLRRQTVYNGRTPIQYSYEACVSG